MVDGITHAIATCDRIERGLTDAAGHAKHALAEMQIELQNMLDAINADRAARGVAPSGRHAAEASPMSGQPSKPPSSITRLYWLH